MLIIDGYNCTYAGAALGGPWAGFSVRQLCSLLQKNDAPAIIVLDGRPKPSEPPADAFPRITLIYSGPGVTADDVIRQLLSRRTDRRQLTVVSNDRAVVGDARRQKARTQSCENFLSGLITRAAAKRAQRAAAEPPEKSAGLVNLGETEHWLKEFGLHPAPPPKPSPTRPKPATGSAPSAKSAPAAAPTPTGKPPGHRKTPGSVDQPTLREPPALDFSSLDERTIAALLGPVDPP